MKVMLVDGNSIISRAFYALPALTNKNGEYTNGIYGFLNILLKLYDEESPEYLTIAFDLPAPTFRHQSYGDYKGTRKPMPMELRPQIPMLKELLGKMGIPVCQIEGYEADDILGTLACQAEERGYEAVIISGDRDLLQIATDKIKIRIPKTKFNKTEVEDYYAADVIEKLGVTPTQYIDVKALMGDSSDNIPGVAGIGEKTAFKIIQQYKSLENAYEHIDSITPKRAAKNMAEYKEQAYLSKELATIITDAPVNLPLSPVSKESMFNEISMAEIERLEFKTLVKKFTKNTEADIVLEDYYHIKGRNGLENILADMETALLSSVNFIIIDGDVKGFSFFSDKNRGFFVEFTENICFTGFLELCKNFFQGEKKKITHDSKGLRVLLAKNGVELNGVVFDTMLGAYILNSAASSYEYNDIASAYLGLNYPSLEDLTGKGKSKIDFSTLEDKVKVTYACRTSHVVYSAYPIIKKEIAQNEQDSLYYDIELPTAEVLSSMETIGVKIDKNALESFDKTLTESIEVLTNEIYNLIGEEFNINSPVQLGHQLFEKLGLKGGKRTKTGYSTAADVLEKLRHSHPVVEKVLFYRTLTKLKSTYCDGLLSVMDKGTEKIYSTFNQTVTATGRLSSTEPNLQNIPVRMELGRQLRKVFIPSDDSFILLDADYSQIELRILAHISGDSIMIDTYNKGEDIHRITASQVLHKQPQEVTSAERSSAKAVNFGIVYGISAFSLSQDLDISKNEAEDYISAYFAKYPQIKKYMDITVENAAKEGYAKTMFGRRRAIPELASSNFNTRAFGERVAMNMPIQGTAADIMKIAMVRVYNRLKEEKLQSRIILQVHDELLIEAKIEEVEIAARILKEEMENAAKLSVPLEVEVHRGKNWFEAK